MTTFPVDENVIISTATSASDGLMSASDKTKLDGITGGGGSGGVDIRDEGTLVRSASAFLDFRGVGVTAAADGTVTIPGGGTSGGVTSFAGRTGVVVPAAADYDAFYITQAEADAQGMPAVVAVSYSGGATPSGPVSYGTGNITLRVPNTPADYWQSRLNTGTSQITVGVPIGYTLNGASTIAAGSSAVFIKESGSAFRRWGA